jgi:hypothetical protein
MGVGNPIARFFEAFLFLLSAKPNFSLETKPFVFSPASTGFTVCDSLLYLGQATRVFLSHPAR